MKVVSSVRAFAFALFALFALAPARARAEPSLTEARELSLSVGENWTLPAGNVRSYSEGVAGIVEIRLTPDGRKFVIVGDKPGDTTLLLLLKNGRQILYSIHVFPRPMEVVEEELSRLLSEDTGLRIRRVGPRLFIEGGVSTEPELARIHHIAGLYPGQVESLVVLGGTAAERKHNVRLDVFFIQLDRTKSSNLGLRYARSVGPVSLTTQYNLLARSFISATAQVVDQPLVALDIAQSNGWARVVKRSTVITSNGVSATFRNGGEQNFQVTAGLAGQLQAIEFGTTVQVLPRYDPATKELHVAVKADVSDLVAPVSAATDLPGRNVTTLDTQVAMKVGQALVLSGIKASSSTRSRTGIPGLSQIPVLGVLFGSHGGTSNEVEGALYVVPSVIETIPDASEALVRELLQAYGDYDGEVDDVNLPQLPHTKRAL